MILVYAYLGMVALAFSILIVGIGVCEPEFMEYADATDILVLLLMSVLWPVTVVAIALGLVK